jgi:hypothetical protein
VTNELLKGWGLTSSNDRYIIGILKKLDFLDHAFCDSLIFFVYDPDSLIPDQQKLCEQIEDERFYKQSGRTLRCILIVNP